MKWIDCWSNSSAEWSRHWRCCANSPAVVWTWNPQDTRITSWIESGEEWWSVGVHWNKKLFNYPTWMATDERQVKIRKSTSRKTAELDRWQAQTDWSLQRSCCYFYFIFSAFLSYNNNLLLSLSLLVSLALTVYTVSSFFYLCKAAGLKRREQVKVYY